MTRHIICVDVVRPFVVINWLQLESRVVVGENVGEAILRTIARQIGKCARLVTSNMFKLFKFFTKSEMEQKSNENPDGKS